MPNAKVDRRWSAHRDNHGDPEIDEIFDHLGEARSITDEPGLDFDALPFDVSEFAEAFTEPHKLGPRRERR